MAFPGRGGLEFEKKKHGRIVPSDTTELLDFEFASMIREFIQS